MSKDGTMLVYDPRPPETTRARLAPRLETLVGKRVLLFDNGKLDPQFRWAFPVVFEVLEGTFTRQFGVSSILHRTEYLLPATPERLSQLAEEIDTLAVDAVVFALLDAGIAQPTVVLAIEAREAWNPDGQHLLWAGCPARGRLVRFPHRGSVATYCECDANRWAR